MKTLQLRHILPCVLVYFACNVNGLKCRASQEIQQNNDFEYVVRMCLRHLRNESDFSESLYRMQNNYESSRNKRHRDEMSGGGGNNNNNNNNNNNEDNRNYYNKNQNRGYPEGFDRFWSPNEKSHNDRNRYGEDDRNRDDGDYQESDYYGFTRNGKEGRRKFKPRTPHIPHSYQQQLQHDRDMMYGHGSRDSTNYFSSNRNKNTKFMFNKQNNYDSPLADIDACVIHCIFQEMQMVDDSGKPNKGLISQKMTQKIRNPELKNFIQDSAEECFDAIDENDFNNYNNNNRHRKSDTMCEWAKTFAMCLEARGRENCDDWNEPIQKATNYNSNNNNNNNNNNNQNNNKNSDDQRHKSKQNDRG